MRVADTDQWTDLVYGVYIELSIGKTVPISWRADVAEYSTAIPNDSPIIAVRVAVARGETPEEEGPFLDGGGITLRVLLDNIDIPIEPRKPSAYLNISTEKSTLLQLSIAGSTYNIRVVRALIASNGQGVQPDPARLYPPTGTLTGLMLWDSMGKPANMAWFTPRTSCFHASISEGADDVRLVVTPNDPMAELEWRRNGGKWDSLVSGLTSSPAAVAASGWTLFEVRVTSEAAEATGFVTQPLIYQIAVTKEPVCHPKCRSCNGAGSDDCLSCYAPLVLHGGKCLYTSCQASGRYFDAASELCFPCHSSCLECENGGAQGCTLCPPLRYLLVASAVEVTGECVVICPFGYFVQPTSQLCKRAPPSVRVQPFYVRLVLRVTVEDFLEKLQMLQTVLRVAAETLAVSPQDVRFHRWDPADDGLKVFYYLEVENPFLTMADVKEDSKIDQWFAALPVPVDSVTPLSHSRLYPSDPRAIPEPFIKWWMWCVMAAIFATVCIAYPMYRIYFIRKHYQMHPYRPRLENQEDFIDEVVMQAPPPMLKNLLHGGYKSS